MGIQFDGINNEIKSQTKIDFPGSVGVAGTLTYEDVANVDSIGIITARTGINIGPTAGVAGTFFADGSYVTAGVVTATTFYGSGANLTSLPAQATIANNADNRVITGGSGVNLNGESNLTFDGTTVLIQNSGSGLRNLLRLKNSNASAGVSGLYFNSTTSGSAFDAACVRNGVNGSGQGRLFLQTNNGSGLVNGLEIEYDGQVTLPTNSLNILDSIVHIGDTNTKIRFPSADTITAETGGSERFRINSQGKVLVNTTTASSQGNSQYSRFEVSGNSSTSTGPGHLSIKRGTASASLSDGDTIGRLIFSGLDGGDFAYIQASVDAATTTDFPGRLMFYTCADGATSATERLRITSGGSIGINQTSPQRILHIGTSGTAEANIRLQGGSDYAELRVKDSDNVFSIHTNIGGAGSVEKLKLGQSDATLNGTTDGVLNLNTTDSRGPFIRYQESGTTKCWVGSGQGLSLGTANDLGLRATTHIRMRSGAEEHAMLTDEGFFAAKGMAGNWVGNQSPASTQSHQFNNTGVSKWVCQFEQEHHAGFGVQILGNTTANSEAFVVYATSNNTTRFRVLWNGNCANTNNSFGSLSDISIKENIVDAKSQWNDIKSIKVRNFNLKNDPDTKMLGVVAQEVETVSPKLVWEDGEGLKGVSYSVLYMKAIKALQEAQTRIETLESKVAALEGS